MDIATQNGSKRPRERFKAARWFLAIKQGLIASLIATTVFVAYDSIFTALIGQPISIISVVKIGISKFLLFFVIIFFMSLYIANFDFAVFKNRKRRKSD